MKASYLLKENINSYLLKEKLIYKQYCNLQFYVDFQWFIHASVIMGVVFSTRIQQISFSKQPP